MDRINHIGRRTLICAAVLAVVVGLMALLLHLPR